EHVVDRLEHIAVANAESLVGRLVRELVPATRIALLEQVQALETGYELRRGLGPLAARRRRALALPRRQAAVDDRAAERRRIVCLVVALADELGVGDVARSGGHEEARLGRPGTGDRDL